MTDVPAYLAIDLGAESGRAVLARFDGERVAIEEAHRFPNRPVRLPDGLHWDALRLFAEVTTGLATAARVAGGSLRSVGVDAWGVDFGLLDRDGALVGNPHHYRDGRTDGILPRLFARVPREELYRLTGIQMLPINTLPQLLAMAGAHRPEGHPGRSPLLAAAETLLTIPDLIGYWLTGVRASERTIASTTQLLDARTGEWAWELIDRVGLPRRLFPPLRAPGTVLGPLLPHVAEETGLAAGSPVVSVGSHDTASAVAAVPAVNEGFAYISSGTWSLVGVETREPILGPAALAANIANEAGVGGTVRVLKNVMGLWLLQECRRAWASTGEDLDYGTLVRLAEEAPAFGPLIDPDHPTLLAPGNMPARLRRLCGADGQARPEGPGATVRCVLESLALKYRWTIERIEAVTGRRIGTIHVVGGGARNQLLCRLTAGATRRPVLAGPVEATALGNALVQALAFGELGSLADIRAVVRRSIEPRAFEPEGSADAWDEAYGRMLRLVVATPEASDG